MIRSIASAWRHIWRAAGHSIAGIAAAWRDELPFRIEIFVLIVALPAAILIARDAWQLGLLIA